MSRKAIPTFEIDASNDLPLWVQLRDRFVYLIDSGYYAPEDKLPSVRKFAAEARISYNTVSKAFMALEREGYIVTKHGSGAYVCGARPVGGVLEVDVITEDYIRNCLDKGATYDEIPQLVSRAIRRLRNDDE